MKNIKMLLHSVLMSLCVLSTSLIATAQDNDRENRTTSVDDNDDNDWGWIGLIGLAGLLGLRNKRRDYDVDRDRRGSTAPGVR